MEKKIKTFRYHGTQKEAPMRVKRHGDFTPEEIKELRAQCAPGAPRDFDLSEYGVEVVYVDKMI